MDHARPPLKYVGGKTQLLPELLARAPKTFGTYYEPFFGGGAFFWAMSPKSALISDSNPELMRMLGALRDDVEQVIERLQSFADHHSAQLFETVRKSPWDGGQPVDTAARMIYLNKTCFNGLFRVNARGEFNVPIGKFKTPPTICDPDNLRACSRTLQGNVELQHWDFRQAVQCPREGDFVYFDPPYLPSSATANFTAFTKAKFSRGDHLALAGEAARLKGRGVQVLLSNAGDKEMRKIYEWAGLKVETVRARRNVNCDASQRGEVVEFLVT